jgi:catechol 2,3-dioxygenase-like lactoylglutathione lyase family enzyme
MYVQDNDAARQFYLNTLEFDLSDMVVMSEHIHVHFTRVNSRHHSLAFGHVPGSTEKFAHLMLQVDDIDAIGAAYDRALKGGAEITQTLGRHTNDRMLSFYLRTPSGFEIEFGTHGLEVDDKTWTVTTHTRPSIWGHEVLDATPTI